MLPKIIEVKKMLDGSYTVNDIYNVPNEGEWVDEFIEVAEWVKNNPDKVTEEILYVTTIEEVKYSKLLDIKDAFTTIEEKGYNLSSLGYRVDATKKSLEDVQGLIKLAEAGIVPMPVQFRDYDNNFHACTLVDLKTLEMEIIAHGVKVYAEKWQLEATVESATTKEQVEAVDPHTMSGYDWEESKG